MKRIQKISPTKRLEMFVKHQWSNLGLIVFVLILGATIIPGSVNADDVIHPTEAEKKATTLMVQAMTNQLVDYGSFPVPKERQAPRTVQVVTTAYSSDVWQTDSTPFVTASGTTVRHGVLAANFLPIGTKVKIPTLYGDEIFVVEDRMNARYRHRLDIWMNTNTEAKVFGVQKLKIEIYE